MKTSHAANSGEIRQTIIINNVCNWQGDGLFVYVCNLLRAQGIGPGTKPDARYVEPSSSGNW